MNATLHRELEKLASAVRRSLEEDVPHGPSWLTEEGERVLAAAEGLLSMNESELDQALSSPQALLEYLGKSWLEIHSVAFKQYEVVVSLAAQPNLS